MAYQDTGSFGPSMFGALGPPGGAGRALGQPLRSQPNANRAQKPTHVRVPISTLMSLLLADSIKPVAAPRPRASQAAAALPGLANRVLPQAPPSVPSLSALFQSRQSQPRSRPMQRPLGRYQNF